MLKGSETSIQSEQKNCPSKILNSSEDLNTLLTCQGNTINKNAGIKIKCALNSLNLDYFINYSSLCDKDEYWWCPVPKNSHLFGYMQLCLMSPDRRCAKSFCMRDISIKKFKKKKIKLSGFPKLDSQAYDVRRAMSHKCIIDRWKSPFVPYGITVPSLCRRFNMPVPLQFLNFLREPS